MVKTTTLAIILAALVISVVFAEEADAAGLVKRAISTVGTWAVSDIPQLPASKIDLADGNIIVGSGSTGLSVNPSGAVDVSNTGFFSIPNIHSIGNVTSTGCAAGQVLKVSGTTWQCAADSGLTSAVTSINADSTATQTIVGVTGNTTASTTGGATTINLGTNVVMTDGSAQTITKGLTINSGTLGGQLNIAGNTFLNTGTITFPTVTGTLATLAGTETLSGKTLTSPIIQGLDLYNVTKTNAYTLTSTDDVILADATTTAFNFTLPTAVGNGGKVFVIKKVDSSLANIVGIKTTSNQRIDGNTEYFRLLYRGQSVVLQSNNTDWNTITDHNYPLYSVSEGATLDRIMTSPSSAVATATSTIVLNTIYATPLVVEKTITIDQIRMRTVAGGASSTMRAGIYWDDGNSRPGQLLVDAGSQGTTTGPTSITFTTGLPITLHPGIYWLASVNNAGTAPTVKGFAVTGLLPIMGVETTMASYIFGYSSASCSCATLPATYPTPTVMTAVPIPMVGVRISG